MSKRIVVAGKSIKLYSDDGRTWVSRKRDLREYRKKLEMMVKITKLAFTGRELT